jgi:thioredoxin 1
MEMKTVNVFITDWCPHCKRAIKWIEELKSENPKFADIEVKIVDEEKQPEISKQYP